MKTQKIILIFIVMVMLITLVAPIVKATGSGNLSVIENEENTNNGNSNNNSLINNEPTANTNNNSNNTSTTNDSNLPQTGVAENTTLFVFIAICIASAIYAYVKVRNYKNI